MGAPLRVPVRTLPNGRFRVAVPAAPGDPHQVTRVFADETAAHAWRDAAVAAHRAGEPLPDAAPFQAVAPPTAVDTAAAAGDETVFARVAWAWWQEHYQQFNLAQPERAASVRRDIERHILPFLSDRGITTGARLRRADYVDWLVSLTDPADPDAAAITDDYTDRLSITEACAVTGRSDSTIDRRIRAAEAAGLITATGVGPEGRWVSAQYVLDVDGGHVGPLPRGPKTGGAYDQDVVSDFRRTFQAILFYGVEIGEWTLSFDPTKVKTPLTQARTSPKRAGLTLAQAHELAGHLHAVHQIALWLMRILGLRIGEAFGLVVGDVTFTDGPRAVVVVRRQGGRSYTVRAGNKTIRTDTKDRLKTSTSERVLVVPRQLTTLLRTVVDVFHTDPVTGEINTTARLIPALTAAPAGGQAAFSTGLRRSVEETGIEIGQFEPGVLPTPKDLRAAIGTDLAATSVPPPMQKRFLGHEAGNSVHDRHYVLDHPSLQPMHDIATKIEALIDAEIPGGILMVATPHRCTTGQQPLLAESATRLDGALADLGWLVVSTDDQDALLVTTDVAALLGTSPKTARALLREQVIPARRVLRDRRSQWAATPDDVFAYQAMLASRRLLTDVCVDLGVDYGTVYGWVSRGGLALEEHAGNLCVPGDTEATLRELADRHHSITTVGMTLDDAATELRTSLSAVEAYATSGYLQFVEGRGPDRRRYVTRDSVAALARRRAG